MDGNQVDKLAEELLDDEMKGSMFWRKVARSVILIAISETKDKSDNEKKMSK